MMAPRHTKGSTKPVGEQAALTAPLTWRALLYNVLTTLTALGDSQAEHPTADQAVQETVHRRNSKGRFSVNRPF